MTQGACGGTPLAMRLRRLWPDRNPLRRATDRAEFAVLVLLLVAFLAGVPLTVLAAVGWTAASWPGAGQSRAGLHRVPAVLLQDAPRPADNLAFPASQVRARWASPAGPRTGMVYAGPGAQAGSTVMVWIDRSGRLAADPADVVDLEILAAVVAPGALLLLLLVIRAYAEIFFDRRRMAAWDADWPVTEPQWTRWR